MTRTKRSRLLAPAVVTVAGSVTAGAVAIGHSGGDALITEVVTLLLGIGYYFLTRSDSDVGAIYGRRPDERQREVLLRASRLALIVMIGAAFICVLITVALGDNYWQADLIGSLGGLAYLLGMMIYGAHDTDGAAILSDVMASSVTSDPERDPDDPANE
jgi:hypothetical protein